MTTQTETTQSTILDDLALDLINASKAEQIHDLVETLNKAIGFAHFMIVINGDDSESLAYWRGRHSGLLEARDILTTARAALGR